MLASEDGEDDAELPSWSRTYCGFRERFVEPYLMRLPKATISLRQAPCVSAEHAKEAKETSDGSCTASTVWDAGIVLAAYVHKSEARTASLEGQKRRCVDLGSGTGIVGLVAAATGAFKSVVLTDLPSVVPLLESNVEENRPSLAGVEMLSIPLRWDDEQEVRDAALRYGPFELIVGGDLLYRPPVVAPLLTALLALATPDTTVLLAASLSHSPETIRLFAKRAQNAGFSVEQLGIEEQAAEFTSEEVCMLRLKLASRACNNDKEENDGYPAVRADCTDEAATDSACTRRAKRLREEA